MNTNEQFISIDNKKFLWQMLYENNIFDNIPNTEHNNIQKIFEESISIINTNFPNETLINKNKNTIRMMIDKTKIFKKSNNLKPLEEVKITLSKDLENKKEEFFNLIKKPSQEEIKFKEEIDNPLNNDEMDKILNKMMSDRNIDINNITKPLSSTNKKVSFDISSNNNFKNINDSNLDFLNKFKKIEKDNNNDKLYQLLEKIIIKQDEILNKLNNINL
tara:strand:- start:311 stop:964 length:654 start_codon:yes stop_codon:yes gene_type:complete